jgi:hypothetical protein
MAKEIVMRIYKLGLILKEIIMQRKGVRRELLKILSVDERLWFAPRMGGSTTYTA